jgi:hypothetical protein
MPKPLGVALHHDFIRVLVDVDGDDFSCAATGLSECLDRLFVPI